MKIIRMFSFVLFASFCAQGFLHSQSLESFCAKKNIRIGIFADDGFQMGKTDLIEVIQRHLEGEPAKENYLCKEFSKDGVKALLVYQEKFSAEVNKLLLKKKEIDAFSGTLNQALKPLNEEQKFIEIDLAYHPDFLGSDPFTTSKIEAFTGTTAEFLMFLPPKNYRSILWWISPNPENRGRYKIKFGGQMAQKTH